MIGVMSALICLIYVSSLVVRQLSPLTSASFWMSEATNVCVMAAAILYVISHVLVLFERHLADSRPSLHGQLVTRCRNHRA